jgi:hypothetical protein
VVAIVPEGSEHEQNEGSESKQRTLSTNQGVIGRNKGCGEKNEVAKKTLNDELMDVLGYEFHD